jgi:hypothetical protein
MNKIRCERAAEQRYARSPQRGMVPVGKDRFAYVDDADFDRVMRCGWNPQTTESRIVYAGNKEVGLMHRFILGDDAPPRVDHRDLDGLNNRRENLRPATMAQNACNARKRTHRRGKPTTSRYVGVRLDARTGRWRAAVTVDGKTKDVGYFADEEEAARARDAAARECYGAFARMNFPQEGEQQS